MPFLKWTESMSVGLPILDSDHRALFRIVNQLHDHAESGAKDEVLGAIFDSLIAYIEFHFAREEKVMKACGFPGLPAHNDEHADFTRYIYEMRARYAGVHDPALTQELLEFLKGWLNTHILIQDMAYKPYITAQTEIDEAVYVVDPGIQRKSP